MTKIFNESNTYGYTQQELDDLNAEAAFRIPELMRRFPAMDIRAAGKTFAAIVATKSARRRRTDEQNNA